MYLRNRSSGFTLLELIITLVIFSIIMAIAIPSFRTMVLNNRLTSQVNEVSSLLSFSRSEASKVANATITVCPTSNPNANNPACSGGTSWGGGWIVMHDVDGDRTRDAADGDRILRVYQAFSGGNTLTVSGLSSSDGSYIQFSGNGFPVPPSLGASAAGTLTICDERGVADARAIVVTVSGQTRQARDSDADGILNDHSGVNISCP